MTTISLRKKLTLWPKKAKMGKKRKRNGSDSYLDLDWSYPLKKLLMKAPFVTML